MSVVMLRVPKLFYLQYKPCMFTKIYDIKTFLLAYLTKGHGMLNIVNFCILITELLGDITGKQSLSLSNIMDSWVSGIKIVLRALTTTQYSISPFKTHFLFKMTIHWMLLLVNE